MDNDRDIAMARSCRQAEQMTGSYTRENHISAQTQTKILSTDIGTNDSRRQGRTQGNLTSAQTQIHVCIQNIDILQRNGQKHGHNEGTGDSRRHKGELNIGFPLTRPLFLRTGNSRIQASQMVR